MVVFGSRMSKEEIGVGNLKLNRLFLLKTIEREISNLEYKTKQSKNKDIFPKEMQSGSPAQDI